MKKLILTLFVFLSSQNLWAQDLAFDDIDANDLNLIIKDFSAAFDHTMVSAATPLGDVFGLELAITGGMVNSKNLDTLSKQEDPSKSFDTLPFINLEMAMSFPMGITAELNYIPGLDADGLKLDRTSLGVKWTMTQSLLKLPVDLAVRAYVSSLKLNFTQSYDEGGGPGSATADLEFSNTITGLQFLVSKNFIFVSPYAGLGYAAADGKLSSNTTSIFAPGFNLSTSQSASPSTTEILLGAEFDLLFIKMGIEYASLFDSSRTAFKLGMAF